MSEVVEGSPRPEGEQADRAWTVADLLTTLRVPMAVAFVLVHDSWWRLGIVAMAAVTDLLDGQIARRYGGSRFGAVLDPVADKLFMACAFGVVAFSGKLEWYEIAGVLIRDIVATVAYIATAFFGRAIAVPARLGGKAVTVAQLITLIAFLTDWNRLRPMAWATTAIGVYAIWDYQRAASRVRTRPA
jgi:CDP-diacylglycerol---glycerol-3-phosphate 3-phosphatidyltransferase